MRKEQPIYISGAGIVSSLGLGKHSTIEALLAEKAGIGGVRYLKTVHEELPVGEVPLSDEEMKTLLGIEAEPTTRSSLMGMLALKEAMEQACLTRDVLPSAAFISGTTAGGMDKTEKYYCDFFRGNGYDAYLCTHDSGVCTETIAGHFGRFAFVATPSTACSSAANSLILGAELIKNGVYDIVVAGGTECLTRFHLNGFNSLMVLDGEPCRPFDADRAGLNLGEGAAYVVLENAGSLARRGVSPLAVLSGYANRCDAFHQTASSDNGEGAYRAMTAALEMAQLSPSQIDYINAHGTGTPNNDKSESAAILRVFGTTHIPPVSSTKAFTGHTTSAAGAIEAVISILALQNDFIPANLRWKKGFEDGIVPQTTTLHKNLRHIVSNSFGFGGNDSTLIFSKLGTESDREVRPVAEKNVYIKACAQISAQAPGADILSFDDISGTEEFLRSRDPVFSEKLAAAPTRRLGKILKRALVTSLEVMRESGVTQPDAIITGTGLGCIENTELFLDSMEKGGEKLLSPTYFMQSTYNTIGSLIALHTHTYGYNTTYAQRGVSFDTALLDAYWQLRGGVSRTVLAGGHDEQSPILASLARKVLDARPEKLSVPCTETAVSFMLDTVAEGALCELCAVKVFHHPQPQQADAWLKEEMDKSGLRAEDMLVLGGEDGKGRNYKKIFGENFTVSGLGMYYAVQLLKGGPEGEKAPGAVLLANRFGPNLSLILLKSLCGK